MQNSMKILAGILLISVFLISGVNGCVPTEEREYLVDEITYVREDLARLSAEAGEFGVTLPKDTIAQINDLLNQAQTALNAGEFDQSEDLVYRAEDLLYDVEEQVEEEMFWEEEEILPEEEEIVIEEILTREEISKIISTATTATDCQRLWSGDKYECYNKVAELTGDASLCEKITDPSWVSKKDECYDNVVKVTNECYLCERISKERYAMVAKDNCYWDCAITTTNPTVCENLKNIEEGHFYDRDACYFQYATRVKDCSICDKLEQPKINCPALCKKGTYP